MFLQEGENDEQKHFKVEKLHRVALNSDAKRQYTKRNLLSHVHLTFFYKLRS